MAAEDFVIKATYCTHMGTARRLLVIVAASAGLLLAVVGCEEVRPPAMTTNTSSRAGRDFTRSWVLDAPSVGTRLVSLRGARFVYALDSGMLRGTTEFTIGDTVAIDDGQYYRLGTRTWGEFKERSENDWRPLGPLSSEGVLFLGTEDAEVVERRDGEFDRLDWNEGDQVALPIYPWMLKVSNGVKVRGSLSVEGLGISEVREIEYRVIGQAAYRGREALVVERISLDPVSNKLAERVEYLLDGETRVKLSRRAFEGGVLVGTESLIETTLFELRGKDSIER